MKQSLCQIRQLNWQIQPYLYIGLFTLALSWTFKYTKCKTFNLNSSNVSYGISRLIKRELLLSTHSTILWSEERTAYYGSCWPKLLMKICATGFCNCHMRWGHFAFWPGNSLAPRSTFPFFGDKINLEISNTFHQNNSTRPFPTVWPTITCWHAESSPGSISKRLNWHAALGLVPKPMSPDTSQVTMFG